MQTLTLEQQREIFKQKRFIAMPIAGTLVWAGIGLVSPFISDFLKVWILYIGTGSIFYIGAALSYITGERFFDKGNAKTSFDGLFYVGMIMSLMVFAIAIPVGTIDHTTIPLSVGILTGLMWMPLSWAIQHWVGYFHTVARTLLVLGAWFLFPEHRYEAISLVIVLIYIVSLVALERRYRKVRREHNASNQHQNNMLEQTN
ncbi:DUF7010 family protein [Glaciecola sp. 1036]|uniref:DUF7010 family protein n=1 Tax=Alteromonadaceae TaxID=72275 RepID=UPI003D04D577